MAWAILDTNIYIGRWERDLYENAIATARRKFVIRHSSVVLSELRRGARTRKTRALVDALHELAHVRWAPTEDDWWYAGRLIRDIGDHQDWDTKKRRGFQNDALIALTARRQGATIVTANRNDFALLARELEFPLVVAGESRRP